MNMDLSKINPQNNTSTLTQPAQALAVIIENITNHMPGHIYWKDCDGVYLGCNDRQAQSLGLRYGQDVIGKTDFDLPWGHDVAEKIHENDRRIIKTKRAEIIEENAWINGRKAIVQSHKAPLFDHNGHVHGIIGISIDISELKNSENKLRKAHQEVAKSERLKSEFIRNMQHDIRTPFVGLCTLAEMLAGQETDPEKKSMLHDMHQCSRELLKYCNELLDFSKIEEGCIPITDKSFHLHDLIDSVVAMEKPVLSQKNLTLEVTLDNNIPPVIVSDPYRLKQILLNILSNAVKFTQIGSITIKVTMHNHPQNTQHRVLNVTISDTGIGIENDKLEEIFERFTKVSPSNRGLYHGRGLGLKIVKQFLHELGGEIHVSSKPSHGSTFNLVFPIKLTLLESIIDETF